MSDIGQEALRAAWLDAPIGQLCAWEQAKAWALREAWRDEGKPDYGMLAHLAGKLNKAGGGQRPGGRHPTPQALGQFFTKVDADASWFPGKHSGAMRGRKRALSGAAAASIAKSAMTMAAKDREPTYARLVTACPNAVVNRTTMQPVAKRAVYTILRERCYDETPDDTWTHQARLSRTALPASVMEKRLAWARYMTQEERHTSTWYFRRCVWTDICNKILPRSEAKANKMVLARKGGKGWMSDGAKHYSRNLRADPSVLKQNSWDTIRIWWAPILTRGKLHVEVLGRDFLGECPEGAATLVTKVRSALNVRFRGDDKPNVIFTDRGRGFYATKSGKITREYSEALRQNGLQAFMSLDASRQPGGLQDLMVHETAVAWVTARLCVRDNAQERVGGDGECIHDAHQGSLPVRQRQL